MSSTITEIKDRLGTILENITSTDTGFVAPRMVKTGSARQLITPALLIFTDSANNELVSDDVMQTRRVYRVHLLYKSMTQGTELQIERACDPYFNAVWRAISTNPTLSYPDNTTPLPGVFDAFVRSDSGFAEIIFDDKPFGGITFNIEVATLYELERK